MASPIHRISQALGSGWRTLMKLRLERLTDAVTCLAIVGTLGIMAMYIWQTATTSRPADATTIRFNDWLPYTQSGHRLGPADAAVTIVEFGDYQCRYCREAEPHLAAILREFEADVALVFRHRPLVIESASYTAARAAECAGEQGAFWPFHHRLLSSPSWQVGDTNEALKQLGVEVGIVDQVGLEACVESEAPVPTITADLNAAADLSVSGTPAFLVNGRLSMGVLDSLSFADIYERVRP